MRYLDLTRNFIVQKYNNLSIAIIIRRRGLCAFLVTLIMLCSILQIREVFADTQIYYQNQNTRLDITISDKGINRISVEKDRILKLVGNDGDYMVDGDTNKGFVFLNSKIAKGNSFPVTIISEKGLIQDVNFKVEGDIDSKTVIIKPKPKVLAEKTKETASLETKITHITLNVLNNNTQKYQERSVNLEQKNIPNIKIEKILEYISPKDNLKAIKIEYLEKRATREEIAKFFPRAIAITERGNNILIVEKL